MGAKATDRPKKYQATKGAPVEKCYLPRNLWSIVAFAWVGPLIDKANREPELSESDASMVVPGRHEATALSRTYEAEYARVKTKYPNAQSSNLLNHTTRTLISLYHRNLLLHSLYVSIEIFARLAGPLTLRQFLRWLQSYGAGAEPPLWQGWLLAVALGATGCLMTLMHHRLFWTGMSMGLNMRQQVTSAIHAKALRLNAASIAHISQGHVVNLVSGDIRRFDDAMPFWLFLWAGPLELGLVLLLVALELGFLPALAGVSATLMLIPIQGALVRPVASIRRRTAQFTDERVRLASEVIQGSLAMKMLSWEQPLAATLARIRAQEAACIRQMARIRAVNMAMQFAITPIVSFATFAVYRALHGQLNVASVFYSLALLHLPKLFMVQFFVLGVQSMTELRVSLNRVDKFLSCPEPPNPLHLHHPTGAASHPPPTKAPAPCTSAQHEQEGGSPAVVLELGPPGPPTLMAEGTAQLPGQGQGQGQGLGLPYGTVSLRGADYDWRSPLGRQPDDEARQQASTAAAQQPESKAKAGAGAGPGSAEGAGDCAPSPGKGLTLQGVRFELRPGELLGVCGEVGAGKSSLLAALLGELQPLPAPGVGPGGGQPGSGALVVGRVAYCPQVPCIVAGSVRENITFGREFDAQRYARVLAACALDLDIAALPAGDATELGERGINLSGGQKARVALARAAYSQPDVALLDDPLSAVDPRVARLLFSDCLGPGGLMQCSTRVLVTHQRQFLPRCDRVLVLRGGRCLALGPWQEVEGLGLRELAASSGAGGAGGQDAQGAAQGQGWEEGEGGTVDALVELLPDGLGEGGRGGGPAPGAVLGGVGGDSLGAAATTAIPLPALKAAGQEGERAGKGGLSQEGPGGQGGEGGAAEGRWGLQGLVSRALGRSKAPLVTSAASKSAVSGQLVQQEERVMGVVPWSVYFKYMRHIGSGSSLAICVALVLGQAVFLASEWWLSLWARAGPDSQAESKWLWVYGMLTGLVLLLSISRSALFFEATVTAATRIHDAMTARVLRAPLAFFHTNPAGRVLNRFSKDLGLVDDMLPVTLFDALQCGFLVLSAFVLVSIAVPFILPVFLPLAGVFVLLRGRYLGASREIKRWEAVTRSPVFASFSATLRSLPTIRAYAVQQRFQHAFLNQLTVNGSWFYAFIATARWIGFRLDVIAATTLMVTALLAMGTRDGVPINLLALALTHVLQLTGFLQWFVRQTAEVENSMTSMERMLEYTDLPQEPPLVAEGGAAAPPGWPSSGALTYEHVSACYRPGLPPVLTDLTFHLAAGTSCGVVGRTGSGKSSLMLTLFRLITLTAGRIKLDGVDTAGLGLDALRRQLAIIPQDPVLFSGSVRSNLDPWGQHQDHELWEVLTATKLQPAIMAAGGLHAKVAEAGDNLSVGQRQLFCLARALLQRAVVLALDEATANVDRGTDELIQGALRDFAHAGGAGRVLLVIAHRIDTVMDTDHLLLLHAGRLHEQGNPQQLAQVSGGAFAAMVAAAKGSRQH